MPRASAGVRPRSSSVSSEAQAIDVVQPRHKNRASAGFETREEPEDVAANRIRNFDGCSGITELAGVTRVSEVIENGFAEHVSSFSPESPQYKHRCRDAF